MSDMKNRNLFIALPFHSPSDSKKIELYTQTHAHYHARPRVHAHTHTQIGKNIINPCTKSDMVTTFLKNFKGSYWLNTGN